MEKTATSQMKTFYSDKSFSGHFNKSKSPIRENATSSTNSNHIPSFGASKAD